MDSADAPSQFYTGLVADLYEPLVSERSRADDYVPFLDRSGTPALELACGSGWPLVDLVERGYAVEGLDASADMLDRCRARAAARRLSVTLHRAEMQSFDLGRRYRSIFLAGASFTLLTTDADAAAALACIHAHLEPGGSALIPLEIPDPDALRAAIGRFRETTTAEGQRLRVALISLDADADGRGLSRRLRYERISADGRRDALERDWRTRSWSPDRFGAMLRGAGFDRVTFVRPGGGRLAPGDAVFVALARRSGA